MASRVAWGESLPIWRFSVAQYHEMGGMEEFVDCPRVELLEGLIVEKHNDDPKSLVTVDGQLSELPLLRFNLVQYHALQTAGILQSGDPVELIEGLLVVKASKQPSHVVSAEQLRDELAAATPTGWFVSSPQPFSTDDSEPEPDAMVVRGHRRDYLHRHPTSDDVSLLLEVADDGLARDRGMKKRLYARTKVPVFWIVNLVQRQIEVYNDPTGPADLPDYRQRRDYGEQEQVPLVIEGREVAQMAVASLLP